MIECRKVSFSQIKHLSSLAKKERALITDDLNTEYLAAFIDNKIVGCAGYSIKGASARLKAAFVLKECRGKGIYKELFECRMSRLEAKNIKVFDAFCTELSVNQFLKSGFLKVSVNQYGITYVKKQL